MFATMLTAPPWAMPVIILLIAVLQFGTQKLYTGNYQGIVRPVLLAGILAIYAFAFPAIFIPEKTERLSNSGFINLIVTVYVIFGCLLSLLVYTIATLGSEKHKLREK